MDFSQIATFHFLSKSLNNTCEEDQFSLQMYSKPKALLLMKWAEMGRNMHRLENYSRRECVEIVGSPSSITNDLLEEHVLLIFEKLAVLLEAMDIVTCHRLEKQT